MHVKYTSAGAGQSAVAAAAYRHAAEMQRTATDKKYDYSNKSDVQHCEVILPHDAPEWAQIQFGTGSPHERSARLWNAIEAEVTRKNGYYSQEFEVALPVEFDNAQNIDLVRDLSLIHI